MDSTTPSTLGAALLALLLIGALLGVVTPSARTADFTPEATRDGLTARARFRHAVMHAIVRALQRRRSRQVVPPGAVAAWCDAIARRLRSGETLRQVLADERPTHVALAARTAPLRRELGSGAAVVDAVAASALAASGGGLDLVWSVLAIASGYGGSAAEPIDRVASALRLRSADAHERSAQSAQARLSAHVLTAVPVLVLALLVSTDPDVRLIVLRPAGGLLVGGGLLLNVLGWSWMRHIVASQTT